MRVGFLGFGEAAYVFSKAMLANGLSGAVAYDCNYRHPSLGEVICLRAADARVKLLPSNAALCAESDLMLSLVTAASAVEAAERTVPNLRADQIYCDCNSISPANKIRIANIVQNTGAEFIEAAIMAPAHLNLRRVPILMTGKKASALAGYLSQFGMNIEIMAAQTGAAAAVKLCRSIVIKGLEALLLECTVTAEHFGCKEAVLCSLNASNPEFKWKELSEYMIGRVLEHGGRRAAEMKEVAAMQREAGIPAIMSAATAEVQSRSSARNSEHNSYVVKAHREPLP